MIPTRSQSRTFVSEPFWLPAVMSGMTEERVPRVHSLSTAPLQASLDDETPLSAAGERPTLPLLVLDEHAWIRCRLTVLGCACNVSCKLECLDVHF